MGKIELSHQGVIFVDFLLQNRFEAPSNGAKNLTKKIQVAIIRAAVRFGSGQGGGAKDVECKLFALFGFF